VLQWCRLELDNIGGLLNPLGFGHRIYVCGVATPQRTPSSERRPFFFGPQSGLGMLVVGC
jgi:hypothetical protein